MWRDANGMMHEGDPPTFGRRERVSDLPYPDNRGQTHSEKCYTWPKHHNCAVRKVEELQQRIATLETAQSEEATEAALTAFAARCEAKDKEIARLKKAAANKWLDADEGYCVVCNIIEDALRKELIAEKAKVADKDRCIALSEEKRSLWRQLHDEESARADKAEGELLKRPKLDGLVSYVRLAQAEAERDAAVAERDRLREERQILARLLSYAKVPVVAHNGRESDGWLLEVGNALRVIEEERTALEEWPCGHSKVHPEDELCRECSP